MAKRAGRKSISRVRYAEYQRVAEHFFNAAKDSIELEYWTAAGVLIVYAAIAYADALSIQQSGQKSVGESHEDAIALLESVIAASDEKEKALNQLRRLIEEKTKVSYLGELYTPAQTRELWKCLERFRAWASGILNR
jgi:HEPN domain-containing protein